VPADGTSAADYWVTETSEGPRFMGSSRAAVACLWIDPDDAAELCLYKIAHSSGRCPAPRPVGMNVSHGNNHGRVVESRSTNDTRGDSGRPSRSGLSPHQRMSVRTATSAS
jgi:hypothetical protein